MHLPLLLFYYFILFVCVHVCAVCLVKGRAGHRVASSISLCLIALIQSFSLNQKFVV